MCMYVCVCEDEGEGVQGDSRCGQAEQQQQQGH